MLRCPGERELIEVSSVGKDGVDGTEDDIGSWNLQVPPK